MSVLAVRAPNHLGDAVMSLPAVDALARAGSVVLYAKPALHQVYEHLGVELRGVGRIEASVALLMAPSLRAAWEARDVPWVIGTPTDGRAPWLSRCVPEATHRRQTYASLAAALGVTVTGWPTLPRRGRSAPLADQHMALFPFGGCVNRQWPHFGELAERLVADGQEVVVYGGPGEERMAKRRFPRRVRCVGLRLADLSSTLERARWVVTNDSGPAHVASASGCRTLVLHLSTTAERTGAAGAVVVDANAMPCRPCMRNDCRSTPRLLCTRSPSVGRVLALLR